MYRGKTSEGKRLAVKMLCFKKYVGEYNFLVTIGF
jgi:hypothetical protein